jgi:predicted MFS family arabinose efflux permease
VTHGRLLLLSATLFLAYADRAVSVAIAAPLKVHFGLSDAALGLLNGAALVIPFAVTSLLLGAARGRVRANRALAAGVLVWTLAAFGFAFAQTYGHLIVGRMLMGVGQAALFPAAVAALGSSSASGRLSLLTAASATGRSGGLLAVGALMYLAASGAATLLPVAPWRFAAVLMLAPNLLVAWLLWRMDSGPPVVIGTRQGSRAAIDHMRSRASAYVPFVTAASSILIVVQSAGAWIPSILVRSAGMSPAQAATAAGLIVLFGAPIGHLGAGRLIRAVPAPTLLVIASVCAVAASAVIAFADHPAALLTGLMLLVMAGGGGAAAAMVGLQPLAPVHLRPAVTAIYLGVATLAGYAVGPLATGALSDAMAGQAKGLALALLGVVTFAGSLCVLSALGGQRAWREVARSETVD